MRHWTGSWIVAARCARRCRLPDLTAYNQKRLTDPSLPPVPALFIICDEYQELFSGGGRNPGTFLADRTAWPCVPHVFELVGQTVDPRSFLTCASCWASPSRLAPAGRRTGEAIDAEIAAHLPETARRAPRCCGWPSASRARAGSFLFLRALSAPGCGRFRRRPSRRAGTWFEPRPFCPRRLPTTPTVCWPPRGEPGRQCPRRPRPARTRVSGLPPS